MTPPIRPEEPPAWEYLMYLRDTNQQELAAEFEQYLRETGQQEMIGVADRQAEYASGRLGRRMERLNTNEREMVQAETEMLRDQPGARGLGALAALARDIPGVEAIQAGLRGAVRGQPYQQALSDIREQQEFVPTPVRGMNRMVGGGLAAAAMPGSPVAQGAGYGGLLNLLSAAADIPATSRAINTVGGAAVGGAAGKLGDMLGTAGRALAGRVPEEALPALKNQRAEAAAPLYRRATQEGLGAMQTPMTPDLDRVLAEPDVADIVQSLRTQRQFRGMDPRDPQMLDAIYKALSDAERRAASPLAAIDPKAVNTGRFAVENIRAAKQQLADAMSRAPGAPMPTYAGAVEEFAAQSVPIEAFKRGYRAMGTQVGARENAEKVAREALPTMLEWIGQQGPEAAEAAAQGMASYGKRRLGQAGISGLVNPLRSTSRNFLLEGGNAMRQVDKLRRPSENRSFLELLQAGGVAGVTPDFGGR